MPLEPNPLLRGQAVHCRRYGIGLAMGVRLRLGQNHRIVLSVAPYGGSREQTAPLALPTCRYRRGLARHAKHLWCARAYSIPPAQAANGHSHGPTDWWSHMGKA